MCELWHCKIDRFRFNIYHAGSGFNFLLCSAFFLFFLNIQKSGNVVGLHCVNQSKQKESSVSPREMAAAQVGANPEKRRMEEDRQTSPDRQMISGGAGSGRTDGGVASVEVEAAEKTAKMKPQPSGEQMEGSSGSEAANRGR